MVRGARQHNLKNIDVTFPRNSLVVVTGPSGSGKSSLALDTVFAEGQRRYVESLSTYARQFVRQLPQPQVDCIEGLSPSICIRQQHPAKNPRSTVGTASQIYDFLRVLYARAGEPRCPKCGVLLVVHTVQQIVDAVLALPKETRFTVVAPLIRNQRGAFKEQLARLRQQGFIRIAVDGQMMDLGEELRLERTQVHNIDVHVDRLSVKPGIRQRLTESVELALKLTGDLVRIAPQGMDALAFSERLACMQCGSSFPDLTPLSFSFNDPAGACETCAGLGEVMSFDPALVVPLAAVSIARGAIAPWGKCDGSYYASMLDRLTESLDVDIHVPWRDLDEGVQQRVLYGSARSAGAVRKGPPGRPVYEGVIPGLERRRREYEKRRHDDPDLYELLDEEFGRFTARQPCEACGGTRLCRQALNVTLCGKDISQLAALTLQEAFAFLGQLSLQEPAAAVAQIIVREICDRMRVMLDLGLDYLSLDRAIATLSAGENGRIRLANQIGSALVGVLYVLDEPSVGLHARDNARLVETLRLMRDRGNTVLVVEHDADTIRAADHIVDMGPGAGHLGGRVVASGTPRQLMQEPRSATGQYLSGARRIGARTARRPVSDRAVVVSGATTHNLAGVTAHFPLNALTCVTGVSGSGKSSLVMDTLLPAARQRLNRARPVPVSGTVEGLQWLGQVVHIDQAPLGRTPRSNPATYTGLFDSVREVFAGLREARARGYTPARFSFNVKGGRCEACHGLGILRVEMHFLPDAYVRCDACQGQRYNRETLEIEYRGKNIAEFLSSTVDECYELLGSFPKIRYLLESMRQVGLGYLELGQSATTLSGGEAQRLRLSKELARRATGRTLYILDEPTTGLHFSDVEVLMAVLDELVDSGNTVVIIEHNLDVIKLADYIIDMGPEGGFRGGHIVACGTPEQVAEVPESHTGRFLRRSLQQ